MEYDERNEKLKRLGELSVTIRELLDEKSALEAALKAPEEDDAYVGRFYRCKTGVFAVTCLDYTYPDSKLCGPGVFYTQDSNFVNSTKVTEGFHTSARRIGLMNCVEISKDEFESTAKKLISAAQGYMEKQVADMSVDYGNDARRAGCNRKNLSDSIAKERME